MLNSFVARHANETTLIDLFDDNTQAAEVATEAGYRPFRRLMRMYRGDSAGRDLAYHPDIFALGAFEYG